MRRKFRKILVTGGAGFIGSAFVRLAVKKGFLPIIVDKLTYAGDLARLKEVSGKFKFYKIDICDKSRLETLFTREKPDAIIHFAAESHVDRSIKDATPFIEANIRGTQVLLDIALKHKIKRFVHISTDEVYGDIEKGKFSEESPLKPNSPYAVSKAAGDLLVKAYVRTFNFPALIVRASNNYGPWQYPEKFIPRAILTVLKNKKIPVYGKGLNVREWLYVEDCALGIWQILERGKIGEVYNLGSGYEEKNIQIAEKILGVMGRCSEGIEFVKDRPGHDIRYSLSVEKILKQTGWRAQTSLDAGLSMTVDWCINNKQWLFGKWEEINKLYK
ncbi:MAG: dTDP-glucose 4,6-dehydratase [Candidatus Omnitrophica bacterium]|nr:dTDP-glucose 4,6-dehydratase [Candidatus Omnitrophota bacterium]